jgi:hypothetical protein
MKRTFLLLSIFAIFISGIFNSSSAQYSQFNVGIEGGPSITSLRTTGTIDSLDFTSIYSILKSNFGFLTGVYGQYNFNKSYALKLAVNYQLKGSDIEGDLNIGGGTIATFNGKFKMDYITIPLLFKGTYGSNIKFFFDAGPYLGILLSNKVTYGFNGTFPGSPIPDTTEDITDSTKSTDIGITMGIGMQVPVSKTMSLTFELRDDLGLINTSDYLSNTDLDLKTNAASLVVGLSFNAGKKYGLKK